MCLLQVGHLEGLTEAWLGAWSLSPEDVLATISDMAGVPLSSTRSVARSHCVQKRCRTATDVYLVQEDSCRGFLGWNLRCHRTIEAVRPGRHAFALPGV